MLRLQYFALGKHLLKQNSQVVTQNQVIRHKFPEICNIGQYSTSNNENTKNNIENVYTGSLSSQVRAVKTFSLSTSILGLIGQPVIYSKSLEIGGTAVMVGACGIVGFFTFVTPLLLHFMTKKYVLYMDYDNSDDTYNATILTFFLFKKQIKFHADDVEVPDVPGVFTTFVAKKVPLFVDLKAFKRPEHVSKIMGYDKPFDLRMYLKEDIKDESNKK